MTKDEELFVVKMPPDHPAKKLIRKIIDREFTKDIKIELVNKILGADFKIGLCHHSAFNGTVDIKHKNIRYPSQEIKKDSVIIILNPIDKKEIK